MDAVELSLFAHRIGGICEEMAATLKRSAFSTNIRDRLDFSCAIFDAAGDLVGQSAAIPVHLGSMAQAMAGVLERLGEARLPPASGAQVVYNDPAHGGTHLPDVTVVMPVVVGGRIVAWAANRAHHADIGAEAPGSMPVSSRLEDEGLCIAPQWFTLDGGTLGALLATLAQPASAHGDFAAQFAANRTAADRLEEVLDGLGLDGFALACDALNDYGERLARDTVRSLPEGVFHAEDVMDDDGCGTQDIPIAVTVRLADGTLRCDFEGTAPAAAGNVNCPSAVTAAAAFYVLRCLMPDHAPACAGALRAIDLRIPPGSILDPPAGSAVAAGNVETSSRVVDVLCLALAEALPDRMPAAAQGTMNNLAMGVRGEWNYYETMAGGHGGAPDHPGAAARQSHMTNTLNTPVEIAERRYPLRLRRYAQRRGSGGAGLHPGGDGLVRSFEFLGEAEVSLITERRTNAPWGLAGGEDGSPGRNVLNGEVLSPKVALTVAPGDVLTIETPGGGGWGSPDDVSDD